MRFGVDGLVVAVLLGFSGVMMSFSWLFCCISFVWDRNSRPRNYAYGHFLFELKELHVFKM